MTLKRIKYLQERWVFKGWLTEKLGFSVFMIIPASLSLESTCHVGPTGTRMFRFVADFLNTDKG
ncbi:hypothetical protein V6Z11_A08G167500 [Gossypium hirsutum]